MVVINAVIMKTIICLMSNRSFVHQLQRIGTVKQHLQLKAPVGSRIIDILNMYIHDKYNSLISYKGY